MSEKEIQGIVAHVFEEQGLAPFARKADNGAEITLLMQNSMIQIGRLLSDTHLTLNEYQAMALETAIYPEEFKVIYPALGITGEAGEVSDKIKKLIRDKGYKGGPIESDKDREDIALELGDVLWYVVTSAHDIDFTLEQIAMMNYLKLQKRKEQGKIGGSGDHRQDVVQGFKEDPRTKDGNLYMFTLAFAMLISFAFGILIGFIC